jgi:Domain of unknown function (DUF4157)
MFREHRIEKPASGNLPALTNGPAESTAVPLSETPAGPSGTAGSQPAPASRSLLQMQRQFGNHYVQCVLALDRQGDGEAGAPPNVEAGIEKARGGGQTLDKGVRGQMESAFGADFSGVRVHTGPEANQLNRDVNAVAFTTGQDVFFRQGAYDPGSSGGRHLLAHELTHVVQQTGAIQTKLTVSPPGDSLEREADEVAGSVMRAEQGGLQRQPEASKEDEEKKKKLHAKSEAEGMQRQHDHRKDEEEKKKNLAGK